MSEVTVVDHISPTSLSTFGDCRLQWFWYGPGGYQSVSRQPSLALGVGVHEALAYYYKAKKRGKTVDPVEFFTNWADAIIDELELDDAEEIKKMAEVRTLGITMLEGYVVEYEREQFEVLAVEKKVSRELPGTDWSIDCRLDAIVRDHSMRQKVFVLEHKTFTRLSVPYLDKDHQFVAEAWAAETLYEPIAGVIYNGLRKQIPSPKVKNPLFERHYIYVNENQVKQFHRRARSMYRMLTADKIAIYPEPNPVRCSMCQYAEPCTAYMRGEDHQFILDAAFTTREQRPEQLREVD